jgi:DNA-binding NarL/FixJ family response regulator
VDYTTLVPLVRESANRSQQLLQGSRLVICVGSRLSLCLFISSFELRPALVGATTTAAEAMELLGRHGVDVLLCTDHLEDGDGADLVVQAKRLPNPPRTLMVVSQPQRVAGIRQAIRAGCDGLCLESNLGRGIIPQALTAISGHGIYVDRSLNALYLQHYPGSGQLPLEPLSARECQVLQLAAGGHRNEEIAGDLFISVETVKSHMRRILQKLQARDRTHAAVLGIRLGFVDWPDPG